MDNVIADLESIGLALSGGGVRAAAFHAGVLKYLAEQSLLENVVHISSVSGGSLFTGLVFHHSNYKWPNSSTYLEKTLPAIRTILTSKSIQQSAILALVLNPFNWQFILSRANVLAKVVKSLWGIDAPLSKINSNLAWSINCTTGETGRRFRFKKSTMGDYEVGYATTEDFPLAKAMAISAAFPGGVGPLTIKTADYSWKKRKEWASETSETFLPPYKKLHLYDGGLYDNLGLEPLFDVGNQSFKQDEDVKLTYLLVSDGGAPLTRQNIPHPLNPFRFKRIADIALDQTRALRVRSFANFVIEHPFKGVLVGIGTDAKSAIKRLATGREKSAKSLLEKVWLSDEKARYAAGYSTTLGRLKITDFDLLAQHGYESAKWRMELFSHV